MKSPVISVVMATYNHAAYVGQAIESVLRQRGVSFEFLIADDGSADSTRQVVQSVKDDRIHFIPHRANRGAGVVINELIKRASGEFVALINSDDYWNDDDKLAFQVDILNEHVSLGASFGRARFVDKRGTEISKSTLSFGSTFDQANRSQGAWLRYFFEHGNCICHPTMLIRRKCYEELGAYNNNLRQLPDFDMWIRLIKKYPIHVSEREMVNFRVLPGENVSSQTTSNSVRIMNEHYLIADTFFDDVGVQHLNDGFADLLKHPSIPTSIHHDIEKALLFFAPVRSMDRAYKLMGMLKVNRLFNSDVHREILEQDYGIDGLWFQNQMAEIDILRPRAMAVLGQQKQYLRNIFKRLLLFPRGGR